MGSFISPFGTVASLTFPGAYANRFCAIVISTCNACFCVLSRCTLNLNLQTPHSCEDERVAGLPYDANFALTGESFLDAPRRDSDWLDLRYGLMLPPVCCGEHISSTSLGRLSRCLIPASALLCTIGSCLRTASIHRDDAFVVAERRPCECQIKMKLMWRLLADGRSCPYYIAPWYI